MAKFWCWKAQQDTRNAQPAAQPAPGPADLAAWAREADVSRLSSQTVREAEDYLNKYRHMNLELSQQMGWRVMAAIEAQVSSSAAPLRPAVGCYRDSPCAAVQAARHWLIVAVGLSPCPRWVMRHQAAVSGVSAGSRCAT